MNSTPAPVGVTDIPIITPTAVHVSRKGARTVTVDCPFCPRRHTHGWPAGNDSPGSRVTHCGATPRTYLITAPSETTR